MTLPVDSALEKEISHRLVGKEILSALQQLAAYIRNQLSADYTSIVVRRPGKQALIGRNGTRRLDLSPGTKIRIHGGQLQVDDQLYSAAVFLNSSPRKIAGQSDLKELFENEVPWSEASAVLPLETGGHLIGWIEVVFVHSPHRWSSEEKLFLRQCATQIQRSTEQARSKKPYSPAAQAQQNKDRERAIAGKAEALMKDFESAPWVILDVSSDGRVAYVSTKLKDILGMTASEVRNGSIFSFLEQVLVEAYHAEAKRMLQRVLDGQQTKCEFFAEVKNETSEGRHFLFQAELGMPDMSRMVLVISDVTRSRHFRDKLDEAKLRSKRLVEYGNLIIIRTDAAYRIKDVVGDIRRIIGVSSGSIMHDPLVWTRILEREDYLKLRRSMNRADGKLCEMREEIRVRNVESGEVRWLLLNAVPLYANDNTFLGWEGFGLDITEKRQTEEELVRQSQRVEALYEVSRALQVNMDPAFVALKGLKALLRATGSGAGFAVFYNRATDFLEVVCAQGLSQYYLDSISKVLRGKNLMRHVIENKKGLLIDNIQSDSRAAVELAQQEGLKSTIVMPLMFEDQGAELQVLGALILFSRRERKFTFNDFDLVAAASSQVALVARQAEYYAAEKRHASSLAALYRLSHQLSKLLTPAEIAQHAFPIIQEELPCKRMWLGIVNEQGTHIEGQGGSGPGMRQMINEVQIELGRRHDFLDEAISTRRAVVVEKGRKMECSGLNRIVDRLKPNTFLIVPLVSLGQVVGVLLVEPTLPSSAFGKRKLPLLSSMASEMATVILARRLESKIADADKMRMAGLLASGVAHNFNNLLQAVMGQASLIEMQLPKESPLVDAAQTIVDAAGKGAGLIKQLLSLTQQSMFSREPFSVNELLKGSRDLYKSLLGASIALEVEVGEVPLYVEADYGQIQQVVSNLIINAREALQDRADGWVRVSTGTVRLSSGEVDRELAPGDYVRIDVEDNGVGMSEERRSRCFEPFYTSKNVDADTGIGFEGSGLGLSLSYSILKQHEGLLMVRSSPGEGAVFSVYLPLQVAESQQSATSGVPARQTVVEQGLQATIFEGEDRSSAAVESSLESLGFSLRREQTEGSLQETLLHCESVNLFVIDIDKASKRVFSLLRGFLAKNNAARAIVVTSDSLEWTERFRDNDQVDVVEKPLGVWAIHASVRKLLYGRGEGPLDADVELEVTGDNEDELELSSNGVVEAVELETMPVATEDVEAVATATTTMQK
jgi:PAS domain S-box-containing protein